MTEFLESLMNKSVKVLCKDQRIIYGVLVCISAPYSIILQNGVCQHESRVNLDLQFHYNPQFASKPFQLGLDEAIKKSFENLSLSKEKLKIEADSSRKEELIKEIKQYEQQTEIAKQYDQEFMKDKYFIGNLVLPGNQIQQVFILE